MMMIIMMMITMVMVMMMMMMMTAHEKGWQTRAVPRRLQETFLAYRSPRNPVRQHPAADDFSRRSPSLLFGVCSPCPNVNALMATPFHLWLDGHL